MATRFYKGLLHSMLMNLVGDVASQELTWTPTTNATQLYNESNGNATNSTCCSSSTYTIEAFEIILLIAMVAAFEFMMCVCGMVFYDKPRKCIRALKRWRRRKQGFDDHEHTTRRQQPQQTRRPPTTSDPQRTRRPPTTSDPQRTRCPPTTPDAQRTRRPPTTPDSQRTCRPPTTPDPQRTRRPPTTPDSQRTRRPPTTSDPQRTRRPPTTPDSQRTRRPPTTSDPQRTRRSRGTDTRSQPFEPVSQDLQPLNPVTAPATTSPLVASPVQRLDAVQLNHKADRVTVQWGVQSTLRRNQPVCDVRNESQVVPNTRSSERSVENLDQTESGQYTRKEDKDPPSYEEAMRYSEHPPPSYDDTMDLARSTSVLYVESHM